MVEMNQIIYSLLDRNFYPMFLEDTNEIVWNYDQYLQSRHWQIVRWQFEQLVPKICVHCGNTKNLNIHHLTYERIGRELPNDLVYLCELCHKRWHSILNYQKEVLKRIYRQRNYIRFNR